MNEKNPSVSLSSKTKLIFFFIMNKKLDDNHPSIGAYELDYYNIGKKL